MLVGAGPNKANINAALVGAGPNKANINAALVGAGPNKANINAALVGVCPNKANINAAIVGACPNKANINAMQYSQGMAPDLRTVSLLAGVGPGSAQASSVRCPTEQSYSRGNFLLQRPVHEGEWRIACPSGGNSGILWGSC